ncbi:hypothetical protein ACOSQ3_028578 [Xanthoceras sorbifolium]
MYGFSYSLRPLLACKRTQIPFIKSNVQFFSNPKQNDRTTESIPPDLAACLNNCTDVLSLKKLHACIFTWGLESNSFLASKLVICYANFGFLDESRWIFDRISNKSDLSLWNSLLVACFRAGHFSKVFRQYKNLRECKIGLDGSTATFCLKACIELGSLEFGRGVHADTFKFGLSMNPFVGSSLIGLYSEYGDMRDACKVFEEIADRDVVVYTSMITGYVQGGVCGVYEAFDVARNMQEEGLDPNRVTLVSLLQAAAQLQALKEGRMIHGYSVRRGIGCGDEVFETSLMDMYIKCKDPRTATCLFGMMNKRTVGSWNALIVGHLQMGQPLEVLELIGLMMRESIRPDLITLANGILCCADLKIFQEGKSIHGYIIRSGIQLDLVATTSLVDMYSKCNNLVQARVLFDGMENRDVTFYNVMMAGYLQNEFICEAIEAFIEMVGADIKPNVGSILSLLSALLDLKDVRRGKCVHGYVIRHELDMNNEISNQFINMYGKCGCVAYARHIFSRIRYRDLLSWTSMMKGYVYHGNADEAIFLFRMMKREKLEHDSVALISLLQAFSQLGCLGLAKEVHSHLYRDHMERETPVINSLITIYAKCGKLDMARNLFENMTYRCLTSWNSIIAAYGMHGYGIDALKLFEGMKKVKVEPDEITFTSILTACSHSGLVEEGLRVYRSMTEEYSIVPREEHYGCMIDLFSRAGRLEEAYDLVKCMPSRQSASALVALLAACRVHGNREMGEVIGRFILDLEPESSSGYALVSNLFAEGGKWDEVARIRAMVTDRGLKMTTGYSRIELR